MSVFGLLTRQRRVVYLLVALLSAAGIAAALSLPSSIYPELQFPRITIVAQGTALGAQQQLFTVTRPLEEAVSVVPGLQRVRSRSIRGASELSLYFAPSTDMMQALQQVQSHVAEVRGDLPPELQIQAERLLPSNFPILTYNVMGNDPARLYDLALYQIRPALAGIPGVGQIEVQGSEIREINVIADPARLATAGLGYSDLADAIKTTLGVQAVGRADANYRSYLVLMQNAAQSPEDVGNVV